MDFLHAHAQVLASEQLKEFLSINKDAYLVHGFTTIAQGKQEPWHVGFYSPTTKKVASFAVGESITLAGEDEAFRESGIVPPLDDKIVEVTLEQALDTAENVRKEYHRAEIVTKIIVLLQNIDGEPTWNLTLVTMAFSLLNVRIDAATGSVTGATKDSLFNLGSRT